MCSLVTFAVISNDLSLHMSLLMVRGDHTANLRGIFSHFDYGWTEPVQRVAAWDAALEEIRYPRPDRPPTLVRKAVAHVTGWTVVLDPELIMFAEDVACTALASELGTAVFGAVCEGTSGSYGFSFFNPDRQRAYMVSDSEVQEDSGQPLQAETGINLAELFEDDVLEITKRMGMDYMALERHKEFFIVELDESHLVSTGSAQEAQLPRPSKKSWWKFW
jgi:hypothetical protein